MDIWCLSHLCVALNAILILLLMTQQMVSWAFGSNEETNLFVSKFLRRGVSKCSEIGVNISTNVCGQKSLELRRDIVYSHSRRSVKNNKLNASWNLTLVISVKIWALISGRTHTSIILIFLDEYVMFLSFVCCS